MQRAQQRLPVLDAGAQMRGPGREVAMMQVVGLDAVLDERAHQRAERIRIVIDAAQQHALAQHRDAGIDDPRAGRARLLGQLARMVGMQHHVGALARRLECTNECGRNPVRRHHRHAAVHAHDLDVLDRTQRAHDFAQPPRRQDQRIAAGQDDLPDVGMRADVIERRRQRGARQRLPAARPDHLAAEAEPAIDRTHVHELEQYAVGIAMHDAFDRTVRVVADRIG